MHSHFEALRILKDHSIPYHRGVEDALTLLRRSEIDLDMLRRLGFRISRRIGGQLVVNYKGYRFGLIV